MKISRLVLLIAVVACFARPVTSRGQTIVVVPQPRTSIGTALVDSIRGARNEFATALANRAAIAAPSVARRATFPLTETQAAEVWGNQVRVLPSATLSPGSKDAALFTELGAQLSGGWRFVLGTTLSVDTEAEAGDPTEGEEDEEAAEEEATDREFRKFVAGGGNVSLAAMRPFGRWNRGLGTHLLFVVPRGWANIPALGNAENVSNFGGEVVVEYQYQRYGNRPAENARADSADVLPFLTFHVDAGIAHGTRSFYRGIGRTNRSAFAFVAPTLSFMVRDQVKLGVTYFFGPSDFRSHQNLSISLSVVPKQPSRANPQQVR